MQDPAAINGLRVQAMFAAVAASLGECLQITEEDSGLFISDDKNLRRPDFLLLQKVGIASLWKLRISLPQISFHHLP